MSGFEIMMENIMRHDLWFECERLLTGRSVEVLACRPSRDSHGWRVDVWIPGGNAAHRFPPLSFVFGFVMVDVVRVHRATVVLLLKARHSVYAVSEFKLL